jgi:hypothetical protein
MVEEISKEAIESRTKVEIFQLLKDAGFKQESQSWHDYENAKNLISWHSGITAQTYEKQLDWIVDYLCL